MTFVFLLLALIVCTDDSSKPLTIYNDKIVWIDNIKAYKKVILKNPVNNKLITFDKLAKIDQDVLILTNIEKLADELACLYDEWLPQNIESDLLQLQELRQRLAIKHKLQAEKVFQKYKLPKDELELYLRTVPYKESSN